MPTPDRTILLVEDDPGHARLVMKNLRRAGVTHQVVWVDDGLRAVELLLRQGAYRQDAAPLPDLVLLDLNLPGLSGIQVLAQLRSRERTRNLPVAMLTTSDQPEEILRCVELGCNAYLRKPLGDAQRAETIARIMHLLSAA